MSGTAMKVALVPQPGLGIVKFWQGIVEIGLRAACFVLAVVVLIAASATQADLDYPGRDNSDSDEVNDLNDKSTSVTGWVIFVAVMAMLIEAGIILIRFLNFPIINWKITIFLIVDIVISSVFAVAYFTAAIPLAVYANDWKENDDAQNADIDRIDRIDDDLAATSAFSFFSLIAFAGLAAWMGLFLFFHWNKPLEYSVTDAAASAGDAAGSK